MRIAIIPLTNIGRLLQTPARVCQAPITSTHSFYIFIGTTDGLLVLFKGVRACWNTATCFNLWLAGDNVDFPTGMTSASSAFTRLACNR